MRLISSIRAGDGVCAAAVDQVDLRITQPRCAMVSSSSGKRRKLARKRNKRSKLARVQSRGIGGNFVSQETLEKQRKQQGQLLDQFKQQQAGDSEGQARGEERD